MKTETLTRCRMVSNRLPSRPNAMLLSSLLGLAACTSASVDAPPRLDAFTPSSADPGTSIEVVGSFVAVRASAVDLRHPKNPPPVRSAHVRLRPEFESESESPASELDSDSTDAGIGDVGAIAADGDSTDASVTDAGGTSGVTDGGVTRDYELLDIVLVEDGRLRGLVPSATPAGRYRVVLTDALGRSIESEGIFVVNSVPGAVHMRTDATELHSGQCSSPIYLEAQGLAAQSSVRVDLSVDGSAQIFATEACDGDVDGDPIDHLILTPEAPTAVFYVKSDVPGSFDVRAMPAGFSDSSLSFAVIGPDALAFHDFSLTGIVGDCLSVRVSRRTASGSNAASADLPVLIRLEPSLYPPHANALIYAGPGCSSTGDLSSAVATLQAGQDSTDFSIKATGFGYLRLVASAADHEEARAFALFVERPAGLKFNQAEVEIPLHGPCVPVTLRLVDTSGNAIFNPSAAGIVFNVTFEGLPQDGTTGGVAILTDESCMLENQVTSVDVTGQERLWLLPVNVGTIDWTAQLGMTQSPPVRVNVFDLSIDLPVPNANAPTGGEPDLVAGNPRGLQLSLSRNGEPWAPTFDLPVVIWTSPSAGTPGAPTLFDEDMDELVDEPFTIEAHHSSGTFWLRTEVAGPLYVSATLDGQHLGGQLYFVGPGDGRVLRFANPPRTVSTTRCEPALPIILQLQDQYGNPVVAEKDYVVELKEDLAAAFHLGIGCEGDAATSDVLPEGESELRFVIRPAQGQQPSGVLLGVLDPNSTNSPSDQQPMIFVDDCANERIDPGEDCDPSVDVGGGGSMPFTLPTLTCGVCSPIGSSLAPACVPEANLCFASADATVEPGCECTVESRVDEGRDSVGDGMTAHVIQIATGVNGSVESVPMGQQIRWADRPTVSLAVVGDFNGLPLELSDSGLDIRGGKILIAGLELNGQNSARGLEVESGTTLWLQNVTIQDVVGTALTVSEGATVYLRDVTIRRATEIGVHAEAGSTLHIDRSTVVENGLGGLKIEGGYSITNSLIARNGNLSSVNAVGGVWLGASSSGTFEHNTVYSNAARLLGADSQTTAGVHCEAVRGPMVVSSIVRENELCTTVLCPAVNALPVRADLSSHCASESNNLYPSAFTGVNDVATPPGLLEQVEDDVASLRLTCGSYNRDWVRQATSISQSDLDGEARDASRDVGSDEALGCE
ncbi:MAG: right-handed parallel beta-helix repeat-containing protein [Deltaproteobacteria bacterium]|nr:right-handed parallel beta-helix repeat-containing protein [Deltaproteobacteria bacterium]